MKTKNEVRIVPKRVLRIIEIVRAGGSVNMLDKYHVCMLVDIIDHKAGLWLYKFCGGRCESAYTNYGIVLDQFTDYLKGLDS